MKAVIQRVDRASVSVDGEVVGSCGKGFMILLGAAKGDTVSDADLLWAKISKLRVFTDSEGKMNLGLHDVDGQLLIISQFTLLANCRHGNRPDFFDAASPTDAEELYRYFVDLARAEFGHVETGVFGAHMEVSLVNNGPVTIILNSDELKKKKAEGNTDK